MLATMKLKEATMTKGQAEFDDDAFDENGVLKDGRRIRVPLMMRDGVSDVQRIAQDAVARRFGLRDVSDLHAPGPRYCTDQAAVEAKEEAYRQMCHDMENAWRNAPVAQPAPAGAAPPVEVEDARPAIPVTDADFARLRQIRDEAYRAMVAELANAWRTPAR